jgi:hypothetical protein
MKRKIFNNNQKEYKEWFDKFKVYKSKSWACNQNEFINKVFTFHYVEETDAGVIVIGIISITDFRKTLPFGDMFGLEFKSIPELLKYCKEEIFVGKTSDDIFLNILDLFINDPEKEIG